MFDRTALLTQFEGDTELLRRIVQMFLEDADVLLSGIRNSIVGGDSSDLANAAHKLKAP